MHRTILLADDSITIQKVVEMTFAESDYEVVSFDNGDDALARVESVAPDLVIADIHMPGASGYDVARQIRQGGSQTPVLLLVGTFEPFDDADVEASGADGFLMKPFDSQELVVRVEELVGGSSSVAPGEIGDGPSPAAGASRGGEPPASEAGPAESEAPAETPAQPEPTPPAIVSEPPAGMLSDGDVERIARRTVELITPEIVREVAREVIPQVAEMVTRERTRRLEQEVE